MDLLNPGLRICHVQLLLGERGGMRSHVRRSQGQASPSARNVRGPCAETLGLGSEFELTARSVSVNIVLTCNEKATWRKNVESSAKQDLLKSFKHSSAELNFSWLSICSDLNM